MKWFSFILIALCGVASADDIVIRNGVKCHRRLIPIHGSHDYRVQYDPVIVEEKVEVRENYVAPYAPPSEGELLGLSQGEYEKRLLGIIERAVRDQSRREDIKILRTLGLQIGEPDSGGSGVYAKSVYSRGYERPHESNFGISIKESVDFVGSDPTDLIANQIGRNVDGVRSLFGDLTNAQADALRDLIQSRAVNTERIARAIEETAKGQADATRIRALSDATKRTSVDRDINVAGTFLQHLSEQLSQNVPNIGGNSEQSSGGSISQVQAVISQKCGKCHDPSQQTYKQGRMDLSKYESLNYEQLASVIKQIRSGAMPPQGEPALTQDEEKLIVDDFVDASVNSK